MKEDEITEQIIQGLWDSFKRCNTQVFEMPKGEGENGAEEILEIIMVKNFLKLVTDNTPQSQEAQRTPRKINTETHTHKQKLPTPRMFKLQKIKDKEKILREPREKQYKLCTEQE